MRCHDFGCFSESQRNGKFPFLLVGCGVSRGNIKKTQNIVLLVFWYVTPIHCHCVSHHKLLLCSQTWLKPAKLPVSKDTKYIYQAEFWGKVSKCLSCAFEYLTLSLNKKFEQANTECMRSCLRTKRGNLDVDFCLLYTFEW